MESMTNFATVVNSSQTLFRTYGIYLLRDGIRLTALAHYKLLQAVAAAAHVSALQVRERASCLMSSKT